MSEEGDTLIEILLAVVIIALSVTAVMGALLTTLTSSAEQRSLAALNSALGSFAQAVQAQVQGKPQASTPATNPLFVNCPTLAAGLTSPYQVVSPPNPAAGPAGTSSILFLSGWAPTPTLTVKLGPTYATATLATTTSVPSSGNVAATFVVPALSSGPQHVWVNDPNEPSATQTVQAPADFVVGSGASNTPSLKGYSLDISNVQQWDPTSATFNTPSPCVSSGMQLVTASGVANNGVSASISFVVTGAAATTVTVSLAPANPVLENTLTFTAQILPPNSTTTPPTGTVSWNFTGSPSTPPGTQNAPTCSNSLPGQPNVTSVSTNSGKTTATCVVPQAAAGNYDITATYGGDQNYPQTPSQSYTFPVQKDGVTVAVSASPSQPVPGVALTFTATITPDTAGDPNPTGTVAWQFASPTPAPTCSNSLQNQPANTTAVSTTAGTTTATCTISSPANATYTVVATYSGDSNFLTGTSTSSSTTVAKGTVTLAVTHSPSNPTTASSLTFTATLSWPTGDPTPTGNVSWSWAGSTATGTITCSNSLNGQPNVTSVGTAGGKTTATCIITSPQAASYTATATYTGNASYNTSAPASDTVAVALGPAGLNIQGIPTATSQDGKPDNGDTIVYTFNQAMAPGSILAGWNGTGSKGVIAQFTKVSGQTQLQICTNTNCGGFNYTPVNLGTVSLADGGKYLGNGFNPTITLTATMTMNAAETAVTITLNSSSGNMAALNPTSTLTTLVWTPSGNALSATNVACSTNPVTENNGAGVVTPAKNF